MENEDFLTAMEQFDEFINGEIIEDKAKTEEYGYPVGVGPHGERIFFMHYNDFPTAKEIWDKRKKRINKDNIAVILSNLYTGEEKRTFKESKEVRERTLAVIERFNKLHFKNKLIFSDVRINMPNIVHFRSYKGYPGYGLFKLDRFHPYRRYIDQFDYVGYLNNMVRE